MGVRDTRQYGRGPVLALAKAARRGTFAIVQFHPRHLRPDSSGSILKGFPAPAGMPLTGTYEGEDDSEHRAHVRQVLNASEYMQVRRKHMHRCAYESILGAPMDRNSAEDLLALASVRADHRRKG